MDDTSRSTSSDPTKAGQATESVRLTEAERERGQWVTRAVGGRDWLFGQEAVERIVAERVAAVRAGAWHEGYVAELRSSASKMQRAKEADRG